MPARVDDPASRAWHLDKRVPLALIFAIAIQGGGVVWFMSASFERIESNTRDIAALGTRVTRLDREGSAQAVQLGRIEEQIGGLRDDIGRMLRIIERQNE